MTRTVGNTPSNETPVFPLPRTIKVYGCTQCPRVEMQTDFGKHFWHGKRCEGKTQLGTYTRA